MAPRDHTAMNPPRIGDTGRYKVIAHPPVHTWRRPTYHIWDTHTHGEIIGRWDTHQAAQDYADTINKEQGEQQ